MPTVNKIMPGVYQMIPDEMTEEQQRRSDKWFDTWLSMFKEVCAAADAHGWYSYEWAVAMKRMNDWQESERGRRDDQTDDLRHPAEQQHNAG